MTPSTRCSNPAKGAPRSRFCLPKSRIPQTLRPRWRCSCRRELDERLAYVLGLVYGDGGVRTEPPYRVAVAFCKDEAGRESANRFSDYCRELFGEEPLLLGDYDGHRQLGYTRKRLIEFLVANGLAKGKADSLGFPEVLFRAEPGVRAAFVAGVIDADGTYQRRGGWAISSIDRAFLVSLQRLLMSLGVPSKIKLNRERRGNWQPLYKLHVVGYTFVERLVDQIEPHSAKAQVNYVPSPGADKGWGYRPSVFAPSNGAGADAGWVRPRGAERRDERDERLSRGRAARRASRHGRRRLRRGALQLRAADARVGHADRDRGDLRHRGRGRPPAVRQRHLRLEHPKGAQR